MDIFKLYILVMSPFLIFLYLLPSVKSILSKTQMVIVSSVLGFAFFNVNNLYISLAEVARLSELKYFTLIVLGCLKGGVSAFCIIISLETVKMVITLMQSYRGVTIADYYASSKGDNVALSSIINIIFLSLFFIYQQWQRLHFISFSSGIFQSSFWSHITNLIEYFSHSFYLGFIFAMPLFIFSIAFDLAIFIFNRFISINNITFELIPIRLIAGYLIMVGLVARYSDLEGFIIYLTFGLESVFQ